MEGLQILTYNRWYPLRFLGFTDPFWSVHEETILATWIVLGILLFTSILIHIGVKKNHPYLRYLAMEYVRFFKGTYTEATGLYNYNNIVFLIALFSFIMLCNIAAAFIPWIEEPTSDVNTTLAFGITSFLYVQGASITAIGIRAYVKEYFTPVFLFPLHVVGKLVTIVSLSFRLFGNIFGGSVITKIYNAMKLNSFIGEMIGMMIGTNLVVTYFFGIFEGLIQAYVFCTLTLTYLAMGVQHNDESSGETV
ncbi:F0F1 ATP synthase subunit A [Candidatus Babeliales bacterium]|nr:F0F1 ATP synthase subunit A [Candidatus Babeliales bacterium]